MRPVNDCFNKAVYEDNRGQGLQCVTIDLNVDLKRKAYALQALVDFSLMIHFFSNQKHS